MSHRVLLSAALSLTLVACTTTPTGPSVMALPGSGKSFDQFRLDEMDCRNFAVTQVGTQDPNQVAVESGVKSGALGTVLGAAAGAAIGGDSRGAAVGAGVGLLGGSMAGSEAGRSSRSEVQRRYDMAFVQCMYAKGHKVPVQGQLSEKPAASITPPPPPPPSR